MSFRLFSAENMPNILYIRYLSYFLIYIRDGFVMQDFTKIRKKIVKDDALTCCRNFISESGTFSGSRGVSTAGNRSLNLAVGKFFSPRRVPAQGVVLLNGGCITVMLKGCHWSGACSVYSTIHGRVVY